MRHKEKMKKGFYYANTQYFERCYYLSGTDKGNKWIDIRTVSGTESVRFPKPEWKEIVNWMGLPTPFDLIRMEYHTTNPTKYHEKV